jgi:hypothetical protein
MRRAAASAARSYRTGASASRSISRWPREIVMPTVPKAGDSADSRCRSRSVPAGLPSNRSTTSPFRKPAAAARLDDGTSSTRMPVSPGRPAAETSPMPMTFLIVAPSHVDGAGSRPDFSVAGCAESGRGNSGVRAMAFSLGHCTPNSFAAALLLQDKGWAGHGRTRHVPHVVVALTSPRWTHPYRPVRPEHDVVPEDVMAAREPNVWMKRVIDHHVIPPFRARLL